MTEKFFITIASIALVVIIIRAVVRIVLSMRFKAHVKKIRIFLYADYNEEITTKTGVPIVVEWKAQICPDLKNLKKFSKAVADFSAKGAGIVGLIDVVCHTFTDMVHSVGASMTPEEIRDDKELFVKKVQESTEDYLNEMGFEFVSFEVGDVTDLNGYFDNSAVLGKSEEKTAVETNRSAS